MKANAVVNVKHFVLCGLYE